MCTECADILLEIMGGKHVEVKKERDGYLEFIKSLQNEGQVTAEEQATAEKELEDVSLSFLQLLWLMWDRFVKQRQ